METKQRSRVYVRSEDGSATTVSSREGNFASKLCRKHRIANLREAVTVGLLPAFVNLDGLQREADRVLGTSTFDRDAEQRVGKQRSGPDERLRKARVADQAIRLRADDLAGAIEPQIDPRARLQLADRSLRILTKAPIDLVAFELDQDLDVYTDLVFASDVTLAVFGDIRIYRGAALVSSAGSFILRAASAKGDLLALTKHTTDGVSLHHYATQA